MHRDGGGGGRDGRRENTRVIALSRAQSVPACRSSSGVRAMKNLQDISGTFIVILVILSSLSGPLRALLSSRLVRLTVQITISRQTLRASDGEIMGLLTTPTLRSKYVTSFSPGLSWPGRARGMGGWTVRSRSNHDLPRKLLIMGDSKIEQEKGQSWHGILGVLGGSRLFELSCYRWG